MVALLMSMAYIPEDVFKKGFHFQKGFLEPFQKAIDEYVAKHPLFGKRGKEEKKVVGDPKVVSGKMKAGIQ